MQPRWAAAIAAAGLVACAQAPRLPDLQYRGAVELQDVPFFAQEDHQCGPAALATVLRQGGVDATPAQLLGQVYLPQREGSLQVELIAATRRHERVPYLLQPQLRDLLSEVAQGRPVLVLQNLGLPFWPRWHYAVVVGFEPGAETLILRSGRERRARMPLARFVRSWDGADRWAMVVVAADELPATADLQAWLRATAAFEALGRNDLALTAYRAAVRRWPQQALGWMALANAHRRQNELVAAATALRHALGVAPSAAAYNNLAQVLMQRGCVDAAATALAEARQLAPAAAVAQVLERTAAELQRYEGPRAACAI